jgi:hypothetical protein
LKRRRADGVGHATGQRFCREAEVSCNNSGWPCPLYCGSITLRRTARAFLLALLCSSADMRQDDLIPAYRHCPANRRPAHTSARLTRACDRLCHKINVYTSTSVFSSPELTDDNRACCMGAASKITVIPGYKIITRIFIKSPLVSKKSPLTFSIRFERIPKGLTAPLAWAD